MTVLHSVKFVFDKVQGKYEVFPINMRNYNIIMTFAKMYTSMRFLLERNFKRDGWKLGDEINTVFTDEELRKYSDN